MIAILLRSLALIAVTLSVAARAESDALPFTLQKIGPDIYAAIDGPAGKSGSNAGIVIGDDSVLLVDSFYSQAATRALIGEVRKLTPKPIRYVVNTHYHIDHTGGDALLRKEGAVIIAHRNVRGWVRTENLHLFGDRITDAARQQIAGLALPDLVIDKDLTLFLGNRRVDIHAVLGHTGGDLVIAVPDAQTLYCGDMVWRQVSPNIIDGTVSLWIATLGAFEHLPGADRMVFVPGHGNVANLKDVTDMRDYLATLSDLTREGREAGLTDQLLIDSVMEKMKPQFGGWDSFARVAPREIRFMAEELDGKKRVPQPLE